MYCNSTLLCCIEQANAFYYPNPYLFVSLILVPLVVFALFGWEKGIRTLKFLNIAVRMYLSPVPKNIGSGTVDPEFIEKFKDL